jgi:phage head maturation protease
MDGIATRSFVGKTPVSINLETGEFSAILTSEASVRTVIAFPGRTDSDGYPLLVEVDEILVAAGADLSRSAGAPVVNSHQTYDIANILGVVDAARVETTGVGQCVVIDARLMPSARHILDALAQGFFRQMSVGYEVQEYEIEMRDGLVPLARAVRWTLLEASLVPVGADANAKIRSAATASQIAISKREVQKTELKRMEFSEALAAAQAALATLKDSVAAIPAAPADASDADKAAVEALQDIIASDDADAAETTSDEPPAATDGEITEMRTLARSYGDDAVKIVNDLGALGAAKSDIQKSLRSLVLKRSATVALTTAPSTKTRSADTATIDTAAIYARRNKR